MHSLAVIQGVWPFSLSNREDGFWERKVTMPWNEQQPEVLDLLGFLLRSVMIRHSKSQTYLDGSPLLSLPDRHTSIVALPIQNSAAAVVAFVEALGAELLQAGLGFGNSRNAVTSRENVLRLLREVVAASTILVNKVPCV